MDGQFPNATASILEKLKDDNDNSVEETDEDD